MSNNLFSSVSKQTNNQNNQKQIPFNPQRYSIATSSFKSNKNYNQTENLDYISKVMKNNNNINENNDNVNTNNTINIDSIMEPSTERKRKNVRMSMGRVSFASTVEVRLFEKTNPKPARKLSVKPPLQLPQSENNIDSSSNNNIDKNINNIDNNSSNSNNKNNNIINNDVDENNNEKKKKRSKQKKLQQKQEEEEEKEIEESVVISNNDNQTNESIGGLSNISSLSNLSSISGLSNVNVSTSSGSDEKFFFDRDEEENGQKQNFEQQTMDFTQTYGKIFVPYLKDEIQPLRGGSHDSSNEYIEEDGDYDDSVNQEGDSLELTENSESLKNQVLLTPSLNTILSDANILFPAATQQPISYINDNNDNDNDNNNNDNDQEFDDEDNKSINDMDISRYSVYSSDIRSPTHKKTRFSIGAALGIIKPTLGDLLDESDQDGDYNFKSSGFKSRVSTIPESKDRNRSDGNKAVGSITPSKSPRISNIFPNSPLPSLQELRKRTNEDEDITNGDLGEMIKEFSTPKLSNLLEEQEDKEFVNNNTMTEDDSSESEEDEDYSSEINDEEINNTTMDKSRIFHFSNFTEGSGGRLKKLVDMDENEIYSAEQRDMTLTLALDRIIALGNEQEQQFQQSQQLQQSQNATTPPTLNINSGINIYQQEDDQKDMSITRSFGKILEMYNQTLNDMKDMTITQNIGKIVMNNDPNSQHSISNTTGKGIWNNFADPNVTNNLRELYENTTSTRNLKFLSRKSMIPMSSFSRDQQIGSNGNSTGTFRFNSTMTPGNNNHTSTMNFTRRIWNAQADVTNNLKSLYNNGNTTSNIGRFSIAPSSQSKPFSNTPGTVNKSQGPMDMSFTQSFGGASLLSSKSPFISQQQLNQSTYDMNIGNSSTKSSESHYPNSNESNNSLLESTASNITLEQKNLLSNFIQQQSNLQNSQQQPSNLQQSQNQPSILYANNNNNIYSDIHTQKTEEINISSKYNHLQQQQQSQMNQNNTTNNIQQFNQSQVTNNFGVSMITTIQEPSTTIKKQYTHSPSLIESDIGYDYGKINFEQRQKSIMTNENLLQFIQKDNEVSNNKNNNDNDKNIQDQKNQQKTNSNNNNLTNNLNINNNNNTTNNLNINNNTTTNNFNNNITNNFNNNNTNNIQYYVNHQIGEISEDIYNRVGTEYKESQFFNNHQAISSMELGDLEKSRITSNNINTNANQMMYQMMSNNNTIKKITLHEFLSLAHCQFLDDKASRRDSMIGMQFASVEQDDEDDNNDKDKDGSKSNELKKKISTIYNYQRHLVVLKRGYEDLKRMIAEIKESNRIEEEKINTKNPPIFQNIQLNSEELYAKQKLLKNIKSYSKQKAQLEYNQWRNQLEIKTHQEIKSSIDELLRSETILNESTKWIERTAKTINENVDYLGEVEKRLIINKQQQYQQQLNSNTINNNNSLNSKQLSLLNPLQRENYLNEQKLQLQSIQNNSNQLSLFYTCVPIQFNDNLLLLEYSKKFSISFKLNSNEIKSFNLILFPSLSKFEVILLNNKINLNKLIKNLKTIKDINEFTQEITIRLSRLNTLIKEIEQLESLYNINKTPSPFNSKTNYSFKSNNFIVDYSNPDSVLQTQFLELRVQISNISTMKKLILDLQIPLLYPKGKIEYAFIILINGNNNNNNNHNNNNNIINQINQIITNDFKNNNRKLKLSKVLESLEILISY